MTAAPTANGTSPAPSAAHEQPALSPMLQEIVDRSSDRYKLGLEPGIGSQQAQDAAWDIAEAAFNAKMVDSIDEGYARIQIGRPLGLPAMASIQTISFIENKKTGLKTACMMAKAKLALCLSRPDLVEYIQPRDLSNTEAVWIGKRKVGKEVAFKFSLEDARIAGLLDRGEGNNYTKYPGPMLSWRACGRLADIIGADILLGVATREELDDEMEQQRAERQELAAAAARGELPQALAAPPQAKAARDFAAEAEVLKKQLLDAITAKSKAAMTAFRKAYDGFKAEAPVDLSDEVQRFYGVEVGRARKVDKPDSASAIAPTPPTPATPPATAPTPAPAAAAATPEPAKPPGKYLPPAQRGDEYDGPDSLEPPFG